MRARARFHFGYKKLHSAHKKSHTYYASTLVKLEHCQEAKALLRPYQSVARRILGDSNDITLTMRQTYARALFTDQNATFADVREAVATLEDVERIARRVFGGSHPDVVWMDQNLRLMRKSLSARETAVAGAK